jgi:hypothetical protein
MRLVGTIDWIKNPDNASEPVVLTNSVYLVEAYRCKNKEIYLLPLARGSMSIEISALELMTSGNGNWKIK